MGAAGGRQTCALSPPTPPRGRAPARTAVPALATLTGGRSRCPNMGRGVHVAAWEVGGASAGLTRCPRGRLRVGGAGPAPGGRRGSPPAELLAPKQHVHGVAGVGVSPVSADPAPTRPGPGLRTVPGPRPGPEVASPPAQLAGVCGARRRPDGEAGRESSQPGAGGGLDPARPGGCPGRQGSGHLPGRLPARPRATPASVAPRGLRSAPLPPPSPRGTLNLAPQPPSSRFRTTRERRRTQLVRVDAPAAREGGGGYSERAPRLRLYRVISSRPAARAPRGFHERKRLMHLHTLNILNA